jgi:hypothetical protein
VGSNLVTHFDSKAGGGGSLSTSLRYGGFLLKQGRGKRGKKWGGGSGLVHPTERAGPVGHGACGGGAVGGQCW